MKKMRKCRTNKIGCSLLAALMLISLINTTNIRAEDKPAVKIDREKLLAAAREIMQAQTYCALVTLDSSGRPQVRTMNPFPPDKDMIVWFATSTATRKAKEIQNDSRVCLYYADHTKATGYVALSGRAVLVNDEKEIKSHWRAYWDQAFPDKSKLVLIKVIPEKLDVLNYSQGMLNDSVTWRTPFLEFDSEKKNK